MFAESCARQFGWSRSRVYLNGSVLLEECFESMCTFDLWERNQKMVFTNLLRDFAKMAEVRRQDKKKQRRERWNRIFTLCLLAADSGSGPVVR